MLWLYKLLMHLIYWASYPYGRVKASNGSLVWLGRLGLIPSWAPNHLWLHAASVGETKVISYLIDYLVKRKPALKIHVTSMTRTGYHTAVRLCRGDNISFSYFPYDSSTAVRRTLEAVQPRMLAIAETEIWPNLIGEASKRSIPIILINARMSQKAFGKYRLIRSTLSKLLSNYDRFFYKTEGDSHRYDYFGVKPAKGAIAGDMKFDAPLLERTRARVQEIRAQNGIDGDGFLFVAGSTRPGEEAILLEIFEELSAERNDFTLVLVPRHIERVGEIQSFLAEKRLAFRMHNRANKGERIILVDKVGLLPELYGAADLSFVGGTLVDIGGHNILEPVWAGCPVLFGPSLHNVEEATEYVIKNNYGALVKSKEELLSVLKKVCSGDIIYTTKKAVDLVDSATATVGEYVLCKLKDV